MFELHPNKLSRREIMALGGLASLGATVPLISSCASQPGPRIAPVVGPAPASKAGAFDINAAKARRAHMQAERARLAQLAAPRPRLSRDQLLAERAKFREPRVGSTILDPAKIELGLWPECFGCPRGPVSFLPPDQVFHEGYVGVAGSGLGFTLDSIGEMFASNQLGLIELTNLIAGGSTKVLLASWLYNFTPTITGRCDVTTSVFAFGNYKLISDDGPGDSHEVGAELNVVLQVSGGNGDLEPLFSRTGANISEYAEFGQGVDLHTGLEVTASVPFQIGVGFIAIVSARGDDTVAEIFMNASEGGGFVCAGVRVENYNPGGLQPQ